MVACEQALLFGRVKRVSRSREAHFAYPNRRACSQAIHMVYLAAQQQNKLIQLFPVCANVGVLFPLDILSQACEKHIQTRFSP